MHLVFKSLARPRRAAKAVQESIPGLLLTEAQTVVAVMCGFKTWDQLKKAGAAPGAQHSLDDEDLPTAELEERIEFQVDQIRNHFKNTRPQAREIVRRSSPTARAVPPAATTRSSSEARPPLRGADVFMPSPFTRFNPRYPELFGVLYDVAKLRITFSQAEEMPGPHLAAEVSFTFRTGKVLTLPGVYFWKFLTLFPRELLDEKGDIPRVNHYCHGSVEDMLRRLRMGYQLAFEAGAGNQLREPAPEWVEVDFARGLLTRKSVPALAREETAVFGELLTSAASAAHGELSKLVDQFMVESLTSPRVELKYVTKGGRGSPYIGPSYEPSTWAGTGHWVMEDLLEELSPIQRHPSGCGGNQSYRDLLQALVAPHFDAALSQACLLAVQTPELYQRMCEQLELPIRSRSKAETRAASLKARLMEQPAHMRNWEFSFGQALVRLHAGRRFDSWRPTLDSDPANQRPTERREKLLAEIRGKKA